MMRHQELLQVEEGELQAEAAEEEEPQGVGELQSHSLQAGMAPLTRSGHVWT